MPKGFTQAEKEQIQRDLLLKGKALIIENGFKKTSVSSITKLSVLPKGHFICFMRARRSFYRYT